MPTLPDGIPWAVWLVAIISTPLLGAVASIAVALITRRDTKAELAAQGVKIDETRTKIDEAKGTADKTLDQVANTHDTNLRDDLDEKFSSLSERLTEHVDAIREDIGGLHSETRDLRRDVTGIRTDARRDRRKLADQEEALDHHLADVPRILDEAFAKHVADCPVRNPRRP